MSEKPKVLIISPKASDALVGCFYFLTGRMMVLGVSVRSSDKYIVFDDEDVTPDGQREAIEFAKAFNLNVLDRGRAYELEHDIVLAPSPESKYYKHKYWAWLSVGLEAYARVFYSIDMEEWWVRLLPFDLRAEKKRLLNTFFPSQALLWERNEKYYAFEGYVMLL